MAEHTSLEFLDWIVWLDEQEERTTRDQYYLAQIATEVRKGNVKHPNRVKLKHLLLKFDRKEVGSQQSKSTMTVEERTKRSKAFWFGLVGMSVPEE